MLGYCQEILTVIFEIAVLVIQNSGGGYSVTNDDLGLIVGEYELTNGFFRN